jgi:hypothetical protein
MLTLAEEIADFPKEMERRVLAALRSNPELIPLPQELLRVAAEERVFDATVEEREQYEKELAYDKSVADALFEWARKRGYPGTQNLGVAWACGDVARLCMVIACRSIPREDAPQRSQPI